jgi:hypothetical protein
VIEVILFQILFEQVFVLYQIKLSLHSLLREEFIEKVDYLKTEVVNRCSSGKRKKFNFFIFFSCQNKK